MLIFDINVTTSCSLRCNYCCEGKWFDKNEKLSNDVFKQISKFINNLKREKWFNRISAEFNGREYTGIELRFWGGEPSLEPEIIKNFFERFKDDSLVSFFLYTNGVNLEKIKPILLESKQYQTFYGNPKFIVQISYDGNPLHDKNRLFSNKIGSSSQTLASIDWLATNEISFFMKSTLPLYGLHDLYDSYLDVKSLIKQYHLNTKYFPTLDYLSNYLLSDTDIIGLKSELSSQLDKIIDDELSEFSENNRYFFKWFESYKPICSAGKNIFSINTNGDIMRCHGCFYSTKYNDLLIANVNSEEVLNKFKETIDLHKQVNKTLPEKCKKCPVEFCLKCNVKSYEDSKELTFDKMWTDYTSQNHLCELYIEIHKAKLKFERQKRNGRPNL